MDAGRIFINNRPCINDAQTCTVRVFDNAVTAALIYAWCGFPSGTTAVDEIGSHENVDGCSQVAQHGITDNVNAVELG